MIINKNASDKPKQTWTEILGEGRVQQIAGIKALLTSGKTPQFQTADDEVYVDIDKETERYKKNIYRNVIDSNVAVVTDGTVKRETNNSGSGSQVLLEVSGYTYIILRFMSPSTNKPLKEVVVMKHYKEAAYLKQLCGV